MAIALNQCPGALNQVDVLFGCVKRFKDTVWHSFSIIADVKCNPRQGVKHLWR